VGATWDWKGDLLNIHQCGNLKADFAFKEVVKVDGEDCARITGEVKEGWPADYSPTCQVDLHFSLARRVPVKGTHRFKSPRRTTTIETKVLEFKPAAK